MSNIALALIVTTAAGLATGIGGLAAWWRGATKPRFLAASLGFSVGVMVHVSLVEMVPRAVQLTAHCPIGGWLVIVAFVGGIGVVSLIDRALPHPTVQPPTAGPRSALLRTGLLTAVVIALHNFPEGLGTFVATLQDPKFGITIGGSWCTSPSMNSCPLRVNMGTTRSSSAGSSRGWW